MDNTMAESCILYVSKNAKKPSLAVKGPSEEEEQVAVVKWCKLHGVPVVHVPNEGKRSAAAGAALKRAGMQSGFPDLFIPKPVNGYHGLMIEMKVGKNKPTANQIEWLKTLAGEGYATCVRWGSDSTIQTIERYLTEKSKAKGNKLTKS